MAQANAIYVLRINVLIDCKRNMTHDWYDYGLIVRPGEQNGGIYVEYCDRAFRDERVACVLEVQMKGF